MDLLSSILYLLFNICVMMLMWWFRFGDKDQLNCFWINSETTEVMAVKTTSLVEGGKIYSSNSAKEVLASTTLTQIYLGNSNIFFLMKWTNALWNIWAKINVECNSFSHCLEMNNILSVIWWFIFFSYLVLLLNLESHLSQEVLFHPSLHGGQGFLKEGRRHVFPCGISDIIFNLIFHCSFCFIKA